MLFNWEEGAELASAELGKVCLRRGSCPDGRRTRGGASLPRGLLRPPTAAPTSRQTASATATRTINKDAINFIAEFDIDDGASTDLSLDVSEYHPSPSADYQSWLLLQEAAG